MPSIAIKIQARYAILTIVFFLIAGCSEKFYTERVFNKSGVNIYDVVIHYGKRQSSFGVLSIDAYAAKGHMKTPPPEFAKVTWSTSNKKTYSVLVDMSLVPQDYDGGVITFVIEQDFSVSVGFFIDTAMAF